jgi:hypothetical protein
MSLAAVLAQTAAFSEIMTQPLRVGLRVRQGDVAVRPDEIERRALETGSPHPRLPREEVERKLKFGAGFGSTEPLRFVSWFGLRHPDLPRLTHDRQHPDAVFRSRHDRPALFLSTGKQEPPGASGVEAAEALVREAVVPKNRLRRP